MTGSQAYLRGQPGVKASIPGQHGTTQFTNQVPEQWQLIVSFGCSTVVLEEKLPTTQVRLKTTNKGPREELGALEGQWAGMGKVSGLRKERLGA